MFRTGRAVTPGEVLSSARLGESFVGASAAESRDCRWSGLTGEDVLVVVADPQVGLR